MNKSSKNEPSLEVLVARFAYASAAVLTLSDMLGTISAGLALRLVEEATSDRTNLNVSRNASSNSANNSTFSFEVEQMQRQMDELILEMKRLRKMMAT